MKLSSKLLLTSVFFSTLFSYSVAAEKLTGNYVGYYTLTMNTHKDNGLGGAPWPEAALTGEMNGSKYMVLGSSIKNGVWRWDFDNNTVTIGGNTLSAMGMLFVPFQAFNRTEIENKRTDQTVKIAAIDEVQLPLIYDESADLYRIEYAQKMYIVPPFKVPGVEDYPIGEAVTSLKVTKASNDSISISTADVEVDIAPDNVPGTRLATVFPAIVQIEFNAPEMQLETDLDSNKDGISDQMAELLYLDLNNTDTDGDNIDDIIETPVYVRGKDSDNDGLSDAHEAGSTANNASIISGLSLQHFRKVTINTSNNETFKFARSTPLNTVVAAPYTLTGELPPQKTDKGEPLNYQLGNIIFYLDDITKETRDKGDGVTLNIKFDQLPEGLEVYRSIKQFTEQSFKKLAWNKVEKNKIALSIQTTTGSAAEPVELILATSEKLVIQTSTQDPTPTNSSGANSSSSSSGGSFDYWLLLCSGLVLVMRRSQKA